MGLDNEVLVDRKDDGSCCRSGDYRSFLCYAWFETDDLVAELNEKRERKDVLISFWYG